MRSTSRMGLFLSWIALYKMPMAEGVSKMMKNNAYGLSRVERDRLVRMAKSGLHYERYLSNKFSITDGAVRDICAQMGNYVCKRVDQHGKHVDGGEFPK